MKNKSPVTLDNPKHKEMNQANKDNRRLNLRLSRKAYKALVKFETLGTAKLKDCTERFFADIIINSVGLDDDGVVPYFDKYDRQWRDFIRPRVNALNIYTKEGRQEILDRFRFFIDKQINETIEANAKNLTLEDKFVKDPKVLEIYQLAKEHGAIESEFSTIVGVSDFTMLVGYLAKLVPKGKKLLFKKAAKAHLIED